MKDTSNFLAQLLITLLPNIGDQRYWQLVEHCGSAQQVLDSEPHQLPILNPQARALLANYQRNREDNPLQVAANKIIETIQLHDGFILSIDDENYPPLLKEIHQPPPILFGKGKLSTLQLPQLAIIGSRHASHAGSENTRLFARHLAGCGFTITSGLAIGIDAVAHQAAIDTNKTTIGVMATGIDTIYPKRHHTLAEKIIESNGVLLTEFRPNTPPKAGHFPKRNRIISGLSSGVLVVESSLKSGSLITARYAMEQNREVFAIPGSIHHPQSKGGHWLIKQGATLVESSQDIIDQLSGSLAYWKELTQISPMDASITNPQSHKRDLSLNHHLDNEERLILESMPYEPTNIDQLIEITQLDSSIIATSLINLELGGLIKRSTWGYERL